MTRLRSTSGARRLLGVLLLLFVGLAALPRPAGARVFSRWRPGTEIGDWMDRSGGRLLHATPVTLNGAPGDLTVYALPGEAAAVADDLGGTLSGADIRSHGGTLALGEARDGHHALRLVIVQPDPLGPTLVFALRQTLRAFSEASQPPSEAPSADMPAYPGARPHFSARTEARGTDFLVSRSPDGVQSVRGFYRQQLLASGWSTALPDGQANPPSLGVYLRGGETMLVLATAAADGDGTTITLLHKRQSLK